MWKKQDDAESTPLEVGPTQSAREFAESLAVMVIGVRDNDREKLGSEPIPQMEGPEFQKQPVSPPTMTTYTDALNKFIKNATEFIEQLQLLSDARDAYVQAMKASKELRQVLDSGDANLRTLMIRMVTMSARVKRYLRRPLHALQEERHFALVEGLRFPTKDSQEATGSPFTL